MPKKIEKKTLTLTAIAKSFSDEAEAWKFLESVRWSDGVVCPHCGSTNEAKFLEPRNGGRKTRTGTKTYRRVWQCACGKQFSVLVGTIFEDSRIPLSKWLLALHEMWADKNGVSSLELSRKLDITQKSAWFMAHRIRYAITHRSFTNKLGGTVEADETYIGGKAGNMHKAKREQKIKGRGTVGKTPVFTVVERGGEVRSQIMEQVTGENVRDALRENVDSSAALMTDALLVYQEVGKEFAAHEMVDHGLGKYVRGLAHINTAEGFFGQLKPSIRGTYRHVSDKHLGRYLGEFDYRYTTRKSKDGNRTVRAIEQARGKRLTYENLTGGKKRQ